MVFCRVRRDLAGREWLDVEQGKKRIQKHRMSVFRRKAEMTSEMTNTPVPVALRDTDTWAGLVRCLGEDCELLDYEPLHAMPMQLIDLVKKELPALLVGMEKKERHLTEFCAERDLIGFAWQRGVSSFLLHTRPVDMVLPHTLETLNEHLREGEELYGYSRSQVETMLADLEGRSCDVDSRLAGYAGWLMSTPQFLEELSELKGKGAATVSKARGFPMISWLHDDATLKDAGHLGRIPKKKSAFRNDYRDFCKRWCLNRLVTWELPEPTGPSGCRLVAGITADLAQQGVGVFIPYGFVNSTNMDLSKLVKELRECTAPEHLRDWVDSGLQERKGAGSKRFARLFAFKHYWELIESRHGSRLGKNKEVLKQVLGTFLGDDGWADAGKQGRALGQKLYTMLNRSRREFERR
jgi:hypothetical protein